MGLLRELADQTGLSAQVTAALADTYKGPWVYAPGAVFADLAAAVADGADCIDGIGQLCGDREHAFGPKASTTTMWRLVDQRIDAAHLPKIREARARARAAAWAAGATPDRCVSSVNRYSFGHHPLLAFLDRPEIAGGEALAGLLRKGNAGSNTAADHISVLDQSLASLPQDWRPDPQNPAAPAVVVRSDSAGATHKFAQACRDRGVGFSFGFPVDARVWDAVDTLNLAQGWYPAIDSCGEIRDGAWVAEATPLVNLSTWPARTRLVLRKERPHPGAQLRFTDVDGMRITAFITDTAPGEVPGQLAGLELRHRQHARVEDRIRQAKAAGLRNLPCHGFDANAAWLEIVLAAADLVAWAQLIGFTGIPELARCEINAFRYRVLHVAARITRGARQLRLRIDATWRWAAAIATAWQRIRAAFP